MNTARAPQWVLTVANNPVKFEGLAPICLVAGLFISEMR